MLAEIRPSQVSIFFVFALYFSKFDQSHDRKLPDRFSLQGKGIKRNSQRRSCSGKHGLSNGVFKSWRTQILWFETLAVTFERAVAALVTGPLDDLTLKFFMPSGNFPPLNQNRFMTRRIYQIKAASAGFRLVRSALGGLKWLRR